MKLLGPHLTEDNPLAVLEAARGKSSRERNRALTASAWHLGAVPLGIQYGDWFRRLRCHRPRRSVSEERKPKSRQ